MGRFMSLDDCSEKQMRKKEKEFATKMNKNHLAIKNVVGDGACLFRSVAYQIHGTEEKHGLIRSRCVNFLKCHKEIYMNFVTDNFEKYLKKMSQNSSYGGNVELNAICNVYRCAIEIYCYKTEPTYILKPNKRLKPGSKPIKLSFHNNIHYNCIVPCHKRIVGTFCQRRDCIFAFGDSFLLRSHSSLMITCKNKHLYGDPK